MSNVVGFAWSYVFEDRNPNVKRERGFIFEWFTSSIKHRTRKFHIVVVKVGYTYDIVYVELTKTICSFQVLVALALALAVVVVAVAKAPYFCVLKIINYYES